MSEETLKLSPEEIKSLRNFLNFGRALTESLSSTQIVRLASAVNEIMPLLETLDSPGIRKLLNVLTESAGDLADLIELVNKYHKSGSLKTALDLITFIGVIKDAMGTQTITGFAENASDAMVAGDQLATEFGGLTGIKELINSAKKASEEADQDKSTVGIFSLLKVLKEPQTQKGIKFLLHFSKNLSK